MVARLCIHSWASFPSLVSSYPCSPESIYIPPFPCPCCPVKANSKSQSDRTRTGIRVKRLRLRYAVKVQPDAGGVLFTDTFVTVLLFLLLSAPLLARLHGCSVRKLNRIVLRRAGAIGEAARLGEVLGLIFIVSVLDLFFVGIVAVGKVGVGVVGVFFFLVYV